MRACTHTLTLRIHTHTHENNIFNVENLANGKT